MNGYLVRGHMKFYNNQQKQEDEDTQLNKYIEYVKTQRNTIIKIYKTLNCQSIVIRMTMDKV
jgi:hypothetical protein